MATGQPKPAFYVVLGIVVVALVAFAFWRMMPGPKGTTSPDIMIYKPGQKEAEHKEQIDPTLLIVKPEDIKWLKEEHLPPVPAASAYKALDKDNTVKFAINVWAGWAPIILANDGFAGGKVWKAPKSDKHPDGRDFKVDLVLIDNPVVMRDTYVIGDIHIGWGTLDMVPLFMQRFLKKDGTPEDARILPRICQQIDWSNGGDGIVVRKKLGNKDINSVTDLKGQRVVLAQNSPSHYFLLNMLLIGGLQPRDVKMDFVGDAFQAAAAFNADKNIAACVSWSPDIYNLTKDEKGPYKLLVTTGQANKLIADVWFARADFARDHPDILEGLTSGIFDAMEDMKAEAPKKKAAELMAKGYKLSSVDDAVAMLGDAHNTNWRENFEFFANPSNPTNFRSVWDTSYALYSHPQIKVIDHTKFPADKVMDLGPILALGKIDKYRTQKDESLRQFAAKPTSSVVAEGGEIVGSRFYIRFFPNSSDLTKKVMRKKTIMKDGKEQEVDVEELYDTNIDKTLDDIAKLVETLGNTRIVIEGHTDSSMKTRVAPQDLPALEADVEQLSKERAEAVRKALLAKYQQINANRINTAGLGWKVPADKDDQSKNRRVEVKVYPAESAEP